MNKQEFIKSLTKEELSIVDSITHGDVIREISRRKLEECNFKFDVGDCFMRKDDDSLFLYKITKKYEDSVDCTELQIFHDDCDSIMYYEMSYSFDYLMNMSPFTTELFDKAEVLYNECVNTINSINIAFYGQLMKCLEEVPN